MLIVFNGMIADMEANEILSALVIELFLRGRKLKIFPVFVSESYFKVPKTLSMNVKYYFIMKIQNKRELQKIASNYSSNIDFKDFMKFYKDCTKQPFSFLVNDATFPSDNPLRFRTDKQTAKTSTLASKNVSQYEFLTGKYVYQKKTC